MFPLSNLEKQAQPLSHGNPEYSLILSRKYRGRPCFLKTILEKQGQPQEKLHYSLLSDDIFERNF